MKDPTVGKLCKAAKQNSVAAKANVKRVLKLHTLWRKSCEGKTRGKIVAWDVWLGGAEAKTYHSNSVLWNDMCVFARDSFDTETLNRDGGAHLDMFQNMIWYEPLARRLWRA